jgi:hypothetical protein
MSASDIIGKVDLPSHLKGTGYGDIVGNQGQGAGLVGLISNIVKIITVVAGLWSLFNLIFAGFSYVTSGDKPDEISKANSRIYMSLIGLVVIVGAMILAGIIGWMLFGDAAFILRPTIYGPGSVSAPPRIGGPSAI